ncbi:MAG: NADH-quinone oxidoreductase subunit L [Chloroflexi bacterium]|nr:NADH-quinone oxidoreductase subunit L [Chloroflexota bacterium]
MLSESLVWLILFAPLASFVVIGLGIRPLMRIVIPVPQGHGNGSDHDAPGRSILGSSAGYLAIIAVGVAFVLSLAALSGSISNHGDSPYIAHDWLTVGNLEFTIGILMDPLTAIMLVVVTSVSLMVQIYSVAYMSHEDDRSYARYFAYMSLFTASMIGLVLSSNIIQLFAFWELVGLSSYLLIGFWFTRPSAVAAAKKAFIVTRIGDFGLLLGIMYLFFNQDAFTAAGLNSLDIVDIYAAVDAKIIAGGVATWIAAGIFAGAVGKSGQFPLHTWLPDAMEGPTPVSALIHAATMVAAGVFLVARFFPIFQASQTMMNVIILLGGFTALFAATMGLVATDIKRVLAYSTVSQLGFMMLALGVGAYSAAIFHLFTHAFFKALLFLSSGSVHHASGTFDMRYMGGLRKVMPWTYASFVIGGISLAGILPFAGGWSKDEVLTAAWNGGSLISSVGFWMALAAAGMTGFYIFRAIILTFHGEFKKGADAEGVEDTYGAQVHLAESPVAMVLPLVVLSVAAIFIGFIVNPFFDLGFVSQHWFTHFLGEGPVHVEVEDFNFILAPIVMLVSISGIALAFLMYQTKTVSAEELGARFKPIYTTLIRKYYFDELYEDLIVRRFFYGGVARTLDWIDKNIIDRTGNIIGWFGANIGTALRQVQTGQLQEYGAAISVGILAIVGLYLWFL